MIIKLVCNIKFVRSRQPGIISLMSYSLLWFVKINTELLRGVFTTQRFNRYGQRRCLEAWHINMNQHALNRDDGSYLPQEYLHLVGK